TVYTDGPQGEPPGAVESRMRSLKDRMREAGIPDEDAEAMLDALPRDTGLPSPSARWLLARSGEVVADEGFAAQRRGPERLAHGSFPEIVPLLRHHDDQRRILVVQTGRDGAELSLERLGRAAPEQVEHIEGADAPITKASTGGWSQARFQRSVEEVWQRNESEVAESIDRQRSGRGDRRGHGRCPRRPCGRDAGPRSRARRRERRLRRHCGRRRSAAGPGRDAAAART